MLVDMHPERALLRGQGPVSPLEVKGATSVRSTCNPAAVLIKLSVTVVICTL